MEPDDAATKSPEEWIAGWERICKVNPEECMKWETFRGKENTAEVLGEKAIALVALISSSLNYWPVSFISGLSGEGWGHIRCGEDEMLKVMTETAAFWLRVVEEDTFNLLPAATRDDFMDAVVAGVCWTIAEKCREKCREPESFARLLLERYDVYGTYVQWLPGEGETPKGTLLWEFAKQVSNVVGIGGNALFVVPLTALVGPHLIRCNVPGLLRG